MLAVGAMSVFVGLTLLSPLVVGPLTSLLGLPAGRLAGVSGRLAKQNAARNPQRTATTAAALMIGLALVSMALTVGESLKAQLRSTLESSVSADYLAVDEGEFPAGVVADVQAVEVDGAPMVETLATFRYDEARVQPTVAAADPATDTGAAEVVEIVSTDLALASELFDFGISEGVASDPTVADPVLVSNEEAEARGPGRRRHVCSSSWAPGPAPR